MPVSEKVRHRLIKKSRKGVELQKQAETNKAKQELQKQAILGKEFGNLKIWHAESRTNPNWPSGYPNGTNGARLNDTINVIHKFFCRDCQLMEEKKKKEHMKMEHMQEEPTSPVLALDEGSIQHTMDKNKESLKRKLMLRRSRNELVDAGIFPPLKTPPAYAEQRRQLERAKTGDLLRHKIQTRPDRQALVEQNILQDSTAHPSIQEKQKQLKRARIADGLNDRLLLRPGPLELVEGNIIPTKELQDAIFDGKLTYTRTCEGEDPNRTSYFLFDEDSISDGAPSPQTSADAEVDQSQYGSSLSSASIPSPPEISSFLQSSGPVLQQQQQQQQQQHHFQTQQFHQVHPTTITSQPQPPFIQLPCTVSPSHQPFTPQPPTSSLSTPSPTNSICSVTSVSSTASSKNGSINGGKSNRIKKPKPKGSSKNKIIKFHEYKGPPSVVKNQQNQLNPNETPYHIMLQQQQLFLQWQLEMQAKNLPFIMPTQKQLESAAAAAVAAAANAATAAANANANSANVSAPTSLSSSTVSSSTTKVSSSQGNNRPPSSLDDMKVADLKAELKKRNLPVSGSKPQLIERLKPYTEAILSSRQTYQQQPSPPQMHSPVQPPTPQPTPPIQHKQKQPQMSQQQNIMVMSPQHENTSLQQTLQSMNAIIVQPVTPASVMGEDSMSVLGNCGSPPMSPAQSEYNSSVSGPMSPESMDTGNYFNSVPSVSSLKSQFSLSQSSLIKGQEPISRPSSVVPMDIDLGASQQINFQTNQAVSSPEATTAFNAAVSLQNLINISQLQASQQSLTHEDLVRIQARQIEDLQRQLQMSQSELRKKEQPVPAPPPPPQLPQQPQLRQQQFILQQNMTSSNATVLNQQHILQPAIVAQQQQPVASQQVFIQSQPQQVMPTLTLAASSMSTHMKNSTSQAMTTSILQNPSLHESLNLGQGQQKLFQFGAQPFVLTSTDDKKQRSNTVPVPINGLTTTTTTSSSSSTSQPNSPTKSTSNSIPNNFYFPAEIPLKEPPKYDEAIKSKQQQQQQLFQNQQATTAFLAALANSHTVAANSGVSKSQYMDDVLEILIRTGEMSASAAEAPLTPKRETGAPASSAPSFSIATTTPSVFVASSTASRIKHQPQEYVNHFSPQTLSPTPVSLVISPAKSPSPGPIKKEPPPPLSISSSINANSPASSDFYDHITNGEDLTFGMDWAGSDSNLDLDLAMPSPNPRTPNNLAVPRDSASVSSGSVHGSEPNLSSVGLSDSECNPATMSIDISDWLDVIMPSSSTTLTPISANFPSDPIMTPKPEDVLEMFNMKESDFNTPTDLTSGMNWEKIIESTKS